MGLRTYQKDLNIDSYQGKQLNNNSISLKTV